MPIMGFDPYLDRQSDRRGRTALAIAFILFVAVSGILLSAQFGVFPPGGGQTGEQREAKPLVVTIGSAPAGRHQDPTQVSDALLASALETVAEQLAAVDSAEHGTAGAERRHRIELAIAREVDASGRPQLRVTVQPAEMSPEQLLRTIEARVDDIRQQYWRRYADSHQEALACERQLYEARTMCDRFLQRHFQQCRVAGRSWGTFAALASQELPADRQERSERRYGESAPHARVADAFGRGSGGAAHQPQSSLGAPVHEGDSASLASSADGSAPAANALADTIQSLRNRLLALRERRIELLMTHRPQHPDVLRLDAQIATLDEQIGRLKEAQATASVSAAESPSRKAGADCSVAVEDLSGELASAAHVLNGAAAEFEQYGRTLVECDADWRRAKVAEAEAWRRLQAIESLTVEAAAAEKLARQVTGKRGVSPWELLVSLPVAGLVAILGAGAWLLMTRDPPLRNARAAEAITGLPVALASCGKAKVAQPPPAGDSPG